MVRALRTSPDFQNLGNYYLIAVDRVFVASVGRSNGEDYVNGLLNGKDGEKPIDISRIEIYETKPKSFFRRTG